MLSHLGTSHKTASPEYEHKLEWESEELFSLPENVELTVALNRSKKLVKITAEACLEAVMFQKILTNGELRICMNASESLSFADCIQSMKDAFNHTDSHASLKLRFVSGTVVIGDHFAEMTDSTASKCKALLIEITIDASVHRIAVDQYQISDELRIDKLLHVISEKHSACERTAAEIKTKDATIAELQRDLSERERNFESLERELQSLKQRMAASGDAVVGVGAEFIFDIILKSNWVNALWYKVSEDYKSATLTKTGWVNNCGVVMRPALSSGRHVVTVRIDGCVDWIEVGFTSDCADVFNNWCAISTDGELFVDSESVSKDFIFGTTKVKKEDTIQMSIDTDTSTVGFALGCAKPVQVTWKPKSLPVYPVFFGRNTGDKVSIV